MYPLFFRLVLARLVLPEGFGVYEQALRLVTIAAAFGVPKLALAPLFILWLGIGIVTKVVFVASIVFFLLNLGSGGTGMQVAPAAPPEAADS